jgi:ankyrin repeat protein
VAASKLGLLDQLSGALEAQGACVAAARDCDGRSCLHYAAGYGHEECADLLLDKGADPKAADGNGGLLLAPRWALA